MVYHKVIFVQFIGYIRTPEFRMKHVNRHNVFSQILFLLSFRVVGAIGFERLALRILGSAVRAIRPAHLTQVRRG